MFGKNRFYSYLTFLPIWSKAHPLSLLGWMWAFLSLKTNTTGNFSQVRLGKDLQAGWRNPGHNTRDLRRPEAKSFSCLLKPRLSQGCMRTAQQGSSGRTLHRPSHHLSWNHMGSRHSSTFKVLFSSPSGTKPLSATSSLTGAHTPVQTTGSP